jgi:hypothetical protein
VFGRRDVGRIEREFLDVLDWELSLTEDDILKHYDQISSFASKQKATSAPAPPPPGGDVLIDGYALEASEGSPLSSASPTPPPQTPSTVVSPSNEMSGMEATVKAAAAAAAAATADLEPEEGEDLHNHSILCLYHSDFNQQPNLPRKRV